MHSWVRWGVDVLMHWGSDLPSLPTEDLKTTNSRIDGDAKRGKSVSCHWILLLIEFRWIQSSSISQTKWHCTTSAQTTRFTEYDLEQSNECNALTWRLIAGKCESRKKQESQCRSGWVQIPIAVLQIDKLNSKRSWLSWTVKNALSMFVVDKCETADNG